MRAIDIAREMKTNVNAVEVQAHRCVGRIEFCWPSRNDG